MGFNVQPPNAWDGQMRAPSATTTTKYEALQPRIIAIIMVMVGVTLTR